MDPKITVISGINKTPAFIEKLVAHTEGRIYTVESLTQFELLDRLSRKYDKKLSILLRLTNDSQFGINRQEIEELMATMKEFAREGKSILFISHKLNEIMEVSDRVSVLRKGKYIGTVNTSETTKQELSNMMVGRPVQLEVTKDEAKPAGEVLKVDHLCVHSHVQKRNAVNDVSFNVRAGEIVCIAGIDGNGQTELVYGLTGLEPVSAGKITLNGEDITKMPIRKRNILGLSHIPEDRHKHGLVLDYTLEDNLVLERYFEPEFTDKAGFLRRDNIRKYAEKLIDQYDIRSGQGAITKTRSMSGGNQQKVIFGRWLERSPQVFMMDEPTRGIDVGAKYEIYELIINMAKQGKTIIVVSSEMPEILGITNRIGVMSNGRLAGIVNTKETNQEELLRLSAKYL